MKLTPGVGICDICSLENILVFNETKWDKISLQPKVFDWKSFIFDWQISEAIWVKFALLFTDFHVVDES